MSKRGLLFVISGPSGSGKTTLRERLFGQARLKNILSKSVSFTTRPPRPAEKKRKDYFFITSGEFRDKLKAKKILEWTRYLGYYYGTPRDFVEENLDRGKYLVFCLDLKGAKRLKELYPKDARTIFVMPPSLEELAERIKKRCRTKKEEMQSRLRLARSEVRAAGEFDYCLVNKDLSEAVKELQGIILKETGVRK